MNEHHAARPLDPSAEHYNRTGVEFGRALGYLDATFAFAATLLVTNLDASVLAWSNWSEFTLREVIPLGAFGLSFTVICAFWWANHKLVARLEAISGRFMIVSLVLLATVALLPFTTDGLGTDDSPQVTVSTVCYAINIAAASLLSIALILIAVRDHLFTVTPTSKEIRARVLALADTPVVFLASIPVALWISGGWARAMWALLLITGPLTARVTRSPSRGVPAESR